MSKDRFKKFRVKKALERSLHAENLEAWYNRHRAKEWYQTPRMKAARRWLAEVKRRPPQSSTRRPPIDASTCHGGPTAEYQEKPRTLHTQGKANTQGSGVFPGSENETGTNDQDRRPLFT